MHNKNNNNKKNIILFVYIYLVYKKPIHFLIYVFKNQKY